MNICPFCGKNIDGKRWHESCSQSFFGTKKPPIVELSAAKMEAIAKEQLNEGKSVAGVQKKLSIHLDGSKGKRKRLTILGYPSGYIIKPQTSEYKQLPELENACMLMAKSCGIDVVPNGLIEIEGKAAYITKRIDRNGNDKIHMEDFCQASNLSTSMKYRSSYEDCAKIIDRYSAFPSLDKSKMFKAIYFSFVVGNSDMHLKNFSFLMDEKGKYHLSPFYDLLPTKVVLPMDREDLALLLNGKKEALNRQDFDIFAETIGLSKLAKEKIMSSVNSSVEKMKEIISKTDINQHFKTTWVRLIEKNLRRMNR